MWEGVRGKEMSGISIGTGMGWREDTRKVRHTI